MGLLMAASKTVAEVRQYVAAAIATGMATDGWQESTIPYDLFLSGEADNLSHKAYAVGVPATDPYELDRQHPKMPVMTVVGIKWSYNLAANDQVSSYDDALNKERQILQALSVARRSEIMLAFSSVTRIVTDETWMLGEITLRAHHLLDISP